MSFGKHIRYIAQQVVLHLEKGFTSKWSVSSSSMTVAGLDPAAFWYRRPTIEVRYAIQLRHTVIDGYSCYIRRLSGLKNARTDVLRLTQLYVANAFSRFPSKATIPCAAHHEKCLITTCSFIVLPMQNMLVGLQQSSFPIIFPPPRRNIAAAINVRR